MGHVIILFGFFHRPHSVWLVMTTQFRFGLDRTCMIGHTIIFSIFIVDRTHSDRSRLFNFTFDIEKACMVSHVIILFGFCYK